MTNKLKKLFTLSISLFLAFSTMIFSVQPVKASSSSQCQISDTTSCRHDLTETLKTFWSLEDLTTLTDDIRFVSFVETNFGTDDFGLYVYVFKAKQIELDNSVDNTKNNVQFGFSYNEEDLFSVDYNKYNIKLLDFYEEANGHYCKYKVTNFTLPESSVPNPTRYYALSGIELLTVGESNATEYTIGNIFKCSGDEAETIISKSPLDTIEVEPHHTFYRTDFSEKNKNHHGYGKGWSNQVSSCYFSLPAAFKVNGKNSFLEAITAEFTLVYSKPIVVVNNVETYNALKENLHNNISLNIDDDSWRNYYYEYSVDDYIIYPEPSSYVISDYLTEFYYDFGYCLKSYCTEYVYNSHKIYNYTFNTLDWLFLKEGEDFGEDFILSSEELDEMFAQIKINSSLSNAIELPSYIEENNLSLCGFNGGKNKHTYSISSTPEENDDVLGYTVKFDDSSWWDLFWNNNQSTTEAFPPLILVNKDDVGLSDEELSRKYYIDKHEISDFRIYVTQQTNLGKDVWIFRYDVCEYYGEKGSVRKYNGSEFKTVSDCLISQEAFYLGFDILQLGLNQDGKRVTLAVNHSPEDIFPPITEAPEPGDLEDKKNGCSDYGSVLSILAGLGLGVVIYILVTKGINFIRKE